MIGYILILEQYNDIQGQLYNGSQFFNCVQDIDNIWFLMLSEQDEQEIAAIAEWNWILTLTEGEYTPKPSPPFPYETH